MVFKDAFELSLLFRVTGLDHEGVKGACQNHNLGLALTIAAVGVGAFVSVCRILASVMSTWLDLAERHRLMDSIFGAPLWVWML